MKNNTNIIWLYWETNKKLSQEPELVSRCKNIFKNFNVIILNEITILEYLDDIVDCSRIEHIAQKTDYYRAKLLYEYGGIWIDFDTILLEDISYLYFELLNSNFDMRGNYDNINNGKVFNPQLLMFKPKSVIAKGWYQYCEKIILSDSKIEWADLGGVGLGKIVHENNYDAMVMQIPRDIRFDLGYLNKSYEKYYSMDEDFINEKINFIMNSNVKYVTLYGTFMYNLNIPENCLLDKLIKLKK